MARPTKLRGPVRWKAFGCSLLNGALAVAAAAAFALSARSDAPRAAAQEPEPPARAAVDAPLGFGPTPYRRDIAVTPLADVSIGIETALSPTDGGGEEAAPAETPSLVWRDAAAGAPDHHPPTPTPLGRAELLFAPKPRARDDVAIALLAGLDGAPGAGAATLTAAAASWAEPPFAELAAWARLRGGAVDDWRAAAAFVKRRAEWPGAADVRAAIERALPDDLAPLEAIEALGPTPPRTAAGARKLGEALIALGRADEGAREVLRGWRDLPGEPSDEAAYLARHAALLAPHRADRLTYHLLSRRTTAATRLAAELGPDWAALTRATAALLGDRAGVDGLIARVPESLQAHPALAYGRLVWRERRKRRADAAALFAEIAAGGDLGRPEPWADARQKYARDAFEDGRADEAYALATGHGLTEGVDFAALEWFAGWLALRRRDDAATALAHFERLWNGVGSPISRSRAAYWAARAAERGGDAAAARLWRERAAQQPQTFYGQLAAEALARPLRLGEAAPGGGETLAPEAAEALEIAAALYRAERSDLARRFLLALAEARPEPDTLRAAIDTATRHGDLETGIKLGGAALEAGLPIWPALYPIPGRPNFTQRRATEPALLLAIARQESRFRAAAESSAGALGLMQMTPPTAAATARGVGIPYDRARLARDPDYNLTLADAHLQDLLARYDGSYLLVAAAYNAGPGNVADWIARFGDPREATVDPIDWIESIPFYETRNYVQRVLESVAFYRLRLGSELDPLALARLTARAAAPPT